jgi:hypothetical protein
LFDGPVLMQTLKGNTIESCLPNDGLTFINSTIHLLLVSSSGTQTARLA